MLRFSGRLCLFADWSIHAEDDMIGEWDEIDAEIAAEILAEWDAEYAEAAGRWQCEKCGRNILSEGGWCVRCQ